MSLFGQVEQISVPAPDYKYITKEEDARAALSYLDNFPTLEIDTEGTSLDPYECRTTLVQIGVPGEVFIFDVRSDLPDVSVHGSLFEPIFTDKNKLKLLQNVNYDMKVWKAQYGCYIENVYDTMLAEMLMTLGVQSRGFSLQVLVNKYLHMTMDKEPRGTFQDYSQTFTKDQLSYAATDVITLDIIRNMQMPRIKKFGLERALDLEMRFTKPLAEMELNGIRLDVDKWRVIMGEAAEEAAELKSQIEAEFEPTQDQTTLFGVSTINIDSPIQLKPSLAKLGIKVEKTDVETLERYKGHPIIDNILVYRKLQKLGSTYGESLIDRISPYTGKLHTEFNQMVSTGRLSSRNPNLQNIPGKQKYRTCFIADEGYDLFTADMSGAELRIMGGLSEEPNFIKAYSEGIDLHTLNASNIFKVGFDEVTTPQRKASKAITFGIAYGMSAVGLSKRLKISKGEAADIIYAYFEANDKLKKWLDSAAKSAVSNRYSTSVSGRKRFYNIPPMSDPTRKAIVGGVGRQGMNAPIQGCVIADTHVLGHGYIENLVGKEIELETGFGKDVAVGVFSGKKEVYNLTFSNGSVLGVTSSHRIPVVTEVGPVEKQVSEINTKEDYFLLPLSVVKGTPTNLSGFKYIKGHWRETFVDFALPKTMTTDLAFILGCLIGDGSYTKHNHIKFCAAQDAIELYQKYNTCIHSVFGYVPVKTERLKNFSILKISQVSSVVIRGFLKSIGLDYVTGINKSVPQYFFTESLANKGALLNGLFSTDGGMTSESGPNYTTISKELASGIHILLFSLGIPSNLKTYEEKGRLVYRIQVPKRFNKLFYERIGFSVDRKTHLLKNSFEKPKCGDGSVVPSFIPKLIYKEFRESGIYGSLSTNQKAHLRRFKLGKCSFDSWRTFYKIMPEGSSKKLLSTYLNFDFCTLKSISKGQLEDTYDLMCENIHYFVANGIVVHNSNADTIKEAMIICVDKLEKLDYNARLLLTVHDELIVTAEKGHREEVAKIVVDSLVEGFGKYLHTIPMESDALIGDCWLKSKCEDETSGTKCGGTETLFVPDEKYGTKLVCGKCGANL